MSLKSQCGGAALTRDVPHHPTPVVFLDKEFEKKIETYRERMKIDPESVKIDIEKDIEKLKIEIGQLKIPSGLDSAREAGAIDIRRLEMKNDKTLTYMTRLIESYYRQLEKHTEILSGPFYKKKIANNRT